jgi:hypothetical protein
MFSGLLEKTAISIGTGAIVGLADAVGFYYSAKMFISNKPGNSRIFAAILEAGRLLLLIALILTLNSQKCFSIFILIGIAFLISLGGKFFFIFKRMKA